MLKNISKHNIDQHTIATHQCCKISNLKYQISNLFFSVRFKSLIFGYLERFDGLKSLFLI